MPLLRARLRTQRDGLTAGHKVTVLTCAPNHPRGILYPGYKNRLFQWDTLEGIRILRVFTFLSPNAGFTQAHPQLFVLHAFGDSIVPAGLGNRYRCVYLAPVFLRDGRLMGQSVEKEALGAGNKRPLAREHHGRRAGDQSNPDSLSGRIGKPFCTKAPIT